MISRALALAWLLPCAAGAADSRLALLVSSSEGSADQARLWFADRDADRVAATLVDLADFSRDDLEVLHGPSAAQMRAAVQRLQARVERARQRGEQPLVVFYYSGHASPQGLQLGGERLPFAEVGALLTGGANGVRIAIVDACHAGVLTQVKGMRRATLDFELPTEPHAEGSAIITSATATEAAQESAALSSSFFTYHLTIGLRGAADADNDGRVTLAEAFRYAYNRTLSSTASAGALPQHATYSMQLAGKGEVVLVDLRRAHSVVEFAAGQGRSYVLTDEKSQEVAAEVNSSDEVLHVALPPGQYRVERVRPTPRLSGTLVVPAVGNVALADASLTEVPTLAARTKGDGAALHTTFGFVQAALATPLMRNFGAAWDAGVGLRFDLGRQWLSATLTWSQKDVADAGYLYTFRAGTATLGLGRWFELLRARLLAGALVGLSIAHQQAADGTTGMTPIINVGPTAALVVPLGGAWGLRAQVGGTVSGFRLNHADAVRVSAELAVALELGL